MEQEDLEDIVIIDVEGTRFKCSRKKLSNCSPYFDAMFNGNFIEKDEKCIKIQQIKDNGFRNILNILNDDSYYINYEELLDTLQVACMLQFDNVKHYCLRRLTDNLELKFCLQIWHISEELDLHPLCEMAKCKALIEFNVLKNSDSILSLDIKHLHLYLSNTLLHCDNEMDVFETGMNWWYEHSKKLHGNTRNDIETKYLLVVLSCVDGSALTRADIDAMLMYPDIKTNAHVMDVLNSINTSLRTNSPRRKQLLPCVVSTELQWDPDQIKRQKSNETMTAVNITCYDHNKKCLKNLFNADSHFYEHYNSSLKGSKIVPYKENLLLYGGEYNYGSSNFNTNVWIYHTFRDQWELLTKMPKERRHFLTGIVADKLFIIGGTGKFRIKLCSDMCYYNLQTGKWTTDIHLPSDMYDMICCAYNGHLLAFPIQLKQSYAYLFDTSTNIWQKLAIHGNVEFLEKFTGMFIVFSLGDSIYIKGNYLVQMCLEGTTLEVKRCIETEPLYGDSVGHCFIGDQLWLFERHNCATFNRILTLKKYSVSSNQTDLCVQINDDMDKCWYVRTGCFTYFHYSLAADSDCISTFKM